MFPLAFLTWVMTLSGVFASISDAKFVLNDGCDYIYGHILDTIFSIRTLTECSWRCGQHNGCVSVKYDQLNLACQLNSEQYDSLSSNCTIMLTYATKTQDIVGKLINEYCTESSECLVTNSQCHHNNCQCDPGYSYKQVNESCVTSCDVYGSTFTKYSGHRISAYNSKTFRNGGSVDDCKKSCVSRTDFVCRSAEYNPEDTTCHLSTKTAVMVANKYEEHDTFDHFTRNCY